MLGTGVGQGTQPRALASCKDDSLHRSAFRGGAPEKLVPGRHRRARNGRPDGSNGGVTRVAHRTALNTFRCASNEDTPCTESPCTGCHSGGPGWIRTTVGSQAGRFTVCSHWPLGHRPMHPVRSHDERSRPEDGTSKRSKCLTGFGLACIAAILHRRGQTP